MKLHFKRLVAGACLFTGIILCASGAKTISVNAATTDTSSESTTASSTEATASDGTTIPSTGQHVIDRKYYKKGVFQSDYTGWKKIKKKIYYFKNGKAVTGWKYLKSYSGGSKTYKYLFKSNGVLVTNLFNYKNNYNKYIKRKMSITVNLTTHNVTIYLWDSKKKSYCIPAKTFICSTSRYKNGTKIRAGKKGRLEKTSATTWFIYKKSNPWRYYQYGVHIKNSESWFHSTLYTTNNAKKLANPTSANGYNYLGTNQTTSCIRLQAVNAKLIYDIATKSNVKQRVWVNIVRSKNKGPFGKVTLNSTTGKLSANTTVDPTDPKYTSTVY
ncbi:MAG: hypothetical protein LUF92_03005 [Clostridiales bacterium]|nr:hypothetical protein [Clostridiales bacterium]